MQRSLCFLDEWLSILEGPLSSHKIALSEGASFALECEDVMTTIKAGLHQIKTLCDQKSPEDPQH